MPFKTNNILGHDTGVTGRDAITLALNVAVRDTGVLNTWELMCININKSINIYMIKYV